MVNEIESDGDGNSISPAEDKIAALRSTLEQLSFHADSELKIECSDKSNLDFSATSQENDSWTATTFSVGNDNGKSSASSSSSSSDLSLVFLRNALPDVPTAKLKQALDKRDAENLEIWDVISMLLKEESIRELEERCLDTSENEERNLGSSNVDRDMSWELPKKKGKEKEKRISRKNADYRPKTKNIELIIPLPTFQRLNSHTRTRCSLSSSADLWTHLSSLSTRLSSLLSRPPSFFFSYFHSPEYATSHDALRSALISLSDYEPSSDLSEENKTLLINILDIVLPSGSDQDLDLNIDQRSRIISDVELAICATEGREDDALDLVYLLRELYDDSIMGLKHLPAPPLSPSQASGSHVSTNGSSRSPLSARPSESLPTSPRRGKANFLPTFSDSSSKRTIPSSDEWKVVSPRRKTIHLERESHAFNIKTCTNDVINHKTASSFPSKESTAWFDREDIYDASHFRVKMRKAMAKRDRALMDAAILYKDSKKNRNREVALYYAEKVCINY